MVDNFDLAHILPSKLRVPYADSHLYSLGLSLFKPKSGVKRHLFYNPIIHMSVVNTHQKYIVLIYRNLEKPIV